MVKSATLLVPIAVHSPHRCIDYWYSWFVYFFGWWDTKVEYKGFIIQHTSWRDKQLAIDQWVEIELIVD